MGEIALVKSTKGIEIILKKTDVSNISMNKIIIKKKKTDTCSTAMFRGLQTVSDIAGGKMTQTIKKKEKGGGEEEGTQYFSFLDTSYLQLRIPCKCYPPL
eukprot:TRINITY_DN10494_c0_g1_i2.p1 TRINITY_DN10494_c0_g1~~TRINITY_DN10494_c0_g1_i2.p1  ORF type:complete len:100 (-),score=12.10 TRINITY_DN10494_c0_g1_i2:689-988(-)